jgi:membrane protease YdiL (CAAX protease family)
VGIGLLGTLPLLGALWWLLHTRTWMGSSVLDFLDRTALPLFARWSWIQLALVSLLAGAGEELLFRWVVQGSLTRLWGEIGGLAAASLLFGAAHLVTWAYGVMAGIVGAYLGVLWIASGNLLVPIVTHAAYDFVALLWLLRRRNSLAYRSDH